jgi:CRISPR-associated protein Cmr2
MKHLLIFTIGPVQSFIAQARKGQDLYAGSQILSNLINFGLDYTANNGHTIIFPYYESSGSAPEYIDAYKTSYPNRFVALLNLDQASDVKAFCLALHSFVLAKLDLTAERLYGQVDLNLDDHDARNQLNDFLEVYWAAVPYQEDVDNYAQKYKILENYLGSVKSVRKFKQLTETGRKCAVNGEYNVKIYRKTADEDRRSDKDLQKNKLFAYDNTIVSSSLVKLRHIQPGEGLCALTFLKRLYKDGQRFPSTAKVSLMHLFEDDNLKRELQKYEQLFPNDTYDEQLLFDENLTEHYFKKYGIPRKSDDYLKTIKEIQGKINASVKKADKKLSRHFAIIRFDGDNMGEWLSKAGSLEEHRAFSKVLLDFAALATKFLDDKRGRTIYAGGDDFLGLVNLTHLFEVLKYFYETFEVLKKNIPIKKGTDEFSISFSVLVSHYKMPLQKALQFSAQLLERTKENVEGKNGIGMAYFKKSGVIGEMITKNKNLGLLENSFNAIHDEKFNSRIIYRFADTFANWKKDTKFKDFDEFSAHNQLIQLEFKRSMLKEVSKKHKDEMEHLSIDLCENLIYTDHTKRTIDFSNLINGIRVLEAINIEI